MVSEISPNSFLNVRPMINLKMAQRLTQAALNAAEELQINIVVCIVDADGNTISYARMDHAPLISNTFAQKKAFTSVALRRSSEAFGQLTLPEQRLYGMQHSDDRLLGIGGGLPIFHQGQIIGAIGISGGLASQDVEIAHSSLASCQLISE